MVWLAPPAPGWEGLVLDGIQVRDVLGYHGVLCREPYLRHWIDQLDACLNLTRGGNRQPKRVMNIEPGDPCRGQPAAGKSTHWKSDTSLASSRSRTAPDSPM